MKRIISLLTVVCLAMGLAACGGKQESSAAATVPAPTQTIPAATKEQTPGGESQAPVQSTAAESGNTEAPSGDRTLVVVFSATGTTKKVAEMIAAITGADIYEIKAAEPYSDADLNWHDKESRTTKEQNDKTARPAIGSDKVSFNAYSRVFIGYPIWWGEEPRIMDTFVELYSFDGITVIPFCTSSSSGIGRSGKNLAENAGNGNWLDGKRFPGSVSENELRSWIEGLK